MAFRVAVEACSADRRRRLREREVAQMKAREAVEAPGPDLGHVLFEEVDRLPEKYRAPVVLCDFEGLTHEAAARSLGCPVGTVSGRLSRARELLRRRLTRRGVVLSAGLAAAFIPPTVSAAVPAALAAATVEAAMKAAVNGAISSAMLRLVDGTLRSMVMTKLKLASAALAATGVALIGLGALAQQRPGDAPAQDSGKSAAPPKASTSSAAPSAVLRDAYQIVRAAEDAPYEVVSTLITIARAQAALGDRPAARSTLEHAARVAARLEPGERAAVLCAMAYARSEAGDRGAIPGLLRDALKDAERVEDEDSKVHLLNEVGTAQAWAGDIASARECLRRLRAIVEATQDADEKAERSQPLVDLQAEVGDYDDALKVAASSAWRDFLSVMIAETVTTRTYHQGRPLREPTPAQKEAGKGILRRILKDNREAPSALVVIALAELGEVDEALRIARAMGPAGNAEEHLSLPCILTSIARSAAISDRPDVARKILREASEIADRHPDVQSGLDNVAEVQAETGVVSSSATHHAGRRLVGFASAHPPDNMPTSRG